MTSVSPISEDDLDIIYYHDMNSLKASYKRLQSMTESDLEQRLNENLSYLEKIIKRRVPNERHEVGFQGIDIIDLFLLLITASLLPWIAFSFMFPS